MLGDVAAANTPGTLVYMRSSTRTPRLTAMPAAATRSALGRMPTAARKMSHGSDAVGAKNSAVGCDLGFRLSGQAQAGTGRIGAWP